MELIYAASPSLMIIEDHRQAVLQAKWVTKKGTGMVDPATTAGNY
jgi:hypothetical protein